ncbi:MAG TPA: SpoIID/LytB domain-containing protein [Gaiellaceae bacterium]|nr:SpoIID/LytB domain-containing protein [Gaiellaceae bacterium]
MLVAAAVLVPTLEGQPAAGISKLIVSGRGFGHGMGLSQWGAEERARAGQSTREILAFYYPGTELRTVAGRSVRVLVGEARTVRVGSTAPFTLRDARGRTLTLPAGLYPVTTAFQVDGRVLAPPLRLEPGNAPLRAGTTGYHGTLTLLRQGRRVLVVDRLGIEDYVRDVVSVECVASWSQNALRAQAVASRSYTLASLRPHARFDLYPDDRSQNYRGLRKEFASATQATEATKGEVLLYRGRVAYTVFSASNGGLTNDTAGPWPPTTLPYLVSRPDPFDERGPDTVWGPVGIDTQKLDAAFPQLPAHLMNVKIARSHAGRVQAITFVGAGGAAVTIDGYTFQQRLGLRSTYLTTVEPARSG